MFVGFRQIAGSRQFKTQSWAAAATANKDGPCCSSSNYFIRITQKRMVAAEIEHFYSYFFQRIKKNFADIKRFEPGPLCCCQLVKIRSRSGIFGRTNQSFFFLFLRFSANCATNKTMRFFPLYLSPDSFFFFFLAFRARDRTRVHFWASSWFELILS